MQQTGSRGAEPSVEDRRLRPSGAVSPADHQPLQGTAILDTHGVIRFCTADAARAFDAAAEDLVGRPVGALVPELKLRRGTPGYNIAYALFWFPQQQWRRVQALSHDGCAFPLEVSVSVARIDGKHQLLLSTRRPRFEGEMRRLQARISLSDRRAAKTSDASGPSGASCSFSAAMRPAINGNRAFCASRDVGA